MIQSLIDIREPCHIFAHTHAQIAARFFLQISAWIQDNLMKRTGVLWTPFLDKLKGYKISEEINLENKFE